jgi:hypothetical protein
MPAISSSNIAGADYDEETRELTIEFQSGATYVYSGVPKEVYESLMTGGGSFFHRAIRSSYPFRRE